MPDPRRSSTDGDDFATVDLINEARRPILIARHRELVTEMEASLSEQFVSGTSDHRRLKSMIDDLSSQSEVSRIARTMKLISEDEHYRDMNLQQALTEFLCLMREEGSVEVAALQMHAIGVYRAVRTLLLKRQTVEPTLAELRELTTVGIGALLDPEEAEFGRLATAQVYTRSFVERTLKDVKRLRQGDQEGMGWEDEDSAAVVTREDEEQVRAMPETERIAALRFLVRDRVRSRFYRAVFLEYLSVDEFDPAELDHHPTVLAWLHSMAETPHLFPFLQGQPDKQKAYRIARLTQKLIQLFEIYARVAMAEADPRHQTPLAAAKGTRERLQYLAKAHYPPISSSHDLTLGTMLCPFKTFVGFVQTRVQAGDFVLPPDPKR